MCCLSTSAGPREAPGPSLPCGRGGSPQPQELREGSGAPLRRARSREGLSTGWESADPASDPHSHTVGFGASPFLSRASAPPALTEGRESSDPEASSHSALLPTHPPPPVPQPSLQGGKKREGNHLNSRDGDAGPLGSSPLQDPQGGAGHHKAPGGPLARVLDALWEAWRAPEGSETPAGNTLHSPHPVPRNGKLAARRGGGGRGVGPWTTPQVQLRGGALPRAPEMGRKGISTLQRRTVRLRQVGWPIQGCTARKRAGLTESSPGKEGPYGGWSGTRCVLGLGLGLRLRRAQITHVQVCTHV